MDPRILRLVEEALEALKEQASDVTRPPRDVLADAGMFEDKMPMWYVGNDWQWRTSPAEAGERRVTPMAMENKKRAATLWVWWRDWVGPVLRAVVDDNAAKEKMINALPAPEPVDYETPEDSKTHIWKSECSSPPVDLWLLCRYWNELTGLANLLPADNYPGASEEWPVFTMLLRTSLYSDLRLRPARVVCRTRDALRWLKEAVATTSAAKTRGMSRQEVTGKLLEIWSDGDPHPGVAALAERVGCSTGAVCEAQKYSTRLRDWSHGKRVKVPLARSLNSVLSDEEIPAITHDPTDTLSDAEVAKQWKILWATAQPKERKILARKDKHERRKLIEIMLEHADDLADQECTPKGPTIHNRRV